MTDYQRGAADVLRRLLPSPISDSLLTQMPDMDFVISQARLYLNGNEEDRADILSFELGAGSGMVLKSQETFSDK